MRTSRTPRTVAALVAMILLPWVAPAPPVVRAQAPPGDGGGGTSFTLPSAGGGDKSITFTISGATVTQVAGAPEGTYTGKVTGDEVTLSGSGKFSIGEGLVTNLSMSVSLSADGTSDGFSWPGPTDNGRVAGPLDWTQSFSLRVPVTKGTTRSVSFGIDLRNCNDWGVCGPVGASGSLTGWTPLCPEAEEFFLDQAAKFDKKGIRVSYDALDAEMRAAIDAWETEHASKASMSPGGDAVAAGMWLFSDGGVDLSRWISSFSLSPDPGTKDGEKALADITVAQGKGQLFDGTFTPPAGSESALAQKIALTSTKEGRRLGMGDVYKLALEQTGGDTMLAALLAHNTLRSLARVGTVGITGIVPDPTFFTKYLTTLRDGDNSGVWYHTFGTMYYQLEVAQGTSTASKIYSVLAVGASGVLYIPSWLFTNATEYFLGWEKPFRFQQMLEAIINGSLPTTDTGWSGFANAAEQAFREIFGGRDPDPEKYCFNVWGTRLAQAIHDRLFPTTPFQIFDDTRTNPYSNLAGDTMPIEPPTGASPFDPTQPLPRIGGTGSPVDVLLEANGVKLFLDQESGTIGASGTFPFPVWPYVTEEDTYGLWWVVPAGTADPQITFIGVDDGTAHLFAANPNAATVEVWSADVTEGDTVVWTPTDFAAVTAEAEVTSAGRMEHEESGAVAPDVITFEYSSDGHVMVEGGGADLLLAGLGALALAAAVGVGILLWRRRTPRHA